MRKIKLLLFLLLLLPFLVIFSQELDSAKMSNFGPMYVGLSVSGQDSAVLYIGGSYYSEGKNAAVTQTGISYITGDFYQGTGNAFVLEGNKGTSTGTVAFIGNDPLHMHHIVGVVNDTINSVNFDRSMNYIAFPHLKILTKGTVAVASLMGIDASTVKKESSNSDGNLRLRSEHFGSNQDTKVYHASLRITDSNTSENLVTSGLVIVEHDVSIYRDLVVDTNGKSNTPLVPFASPFKDQRAAYFAGNFVRQFLKDENAHVQYVYANKSRGGTIALEQYVRNPESEFVSGDGYLVRLRPADFQYDSLDLALLDIIGRPSSQNLDAGVFTFDGNPYSLHYKPEQLFAENAITRSVTTSLNGKTGNWIFGNSYTAPLNVESIIDALEKSDIVFSKSIYFYPVGATAWQEYNAGTINPTNIPTEIPSMSIFMVRIHKNTPVGKSFSLDRSMQMHAKAPHNNMKAPSTQYYDEVQFRVSLADNNLIHDVMAIGIRENASFNADGQDKAKLMNTSDFFQIYSVSDDNNNLSVNVVPNEYQPVKLAFIPGERDAQYNLQANRIESLTKGEGLWLEDLLMGTITDLYATDGAYSFSATASDLTNRFLVHFVNPIPTDLDNTSENSTNDLLVFGADNQVHIMRLTEAHMNAPIRLYDMQGRLLISQNVYQYPHQVLDISHLPKGVYIVKIEGQNSTTAKVVK